MQDVMLAVDIAADVQDQTMVNLLERQSMVQHTNSIPQILTVFLYLISQLHRAHHQMFALRPFRQRH
jgi:hypothetical protein